MLVTEPVSHCLDQINSYATNECCVNMVTRNHYSLNPDTQLRAVAFEESPNVDFQKIFCNDNSPLMTKLG